MTGGAIVMRRRYRGVARRAMAAPERRRAHRRYRLDREGRRDPGATHSVLRAASHISGAAIPVDITGWHRSVRWQVAKLHLGARAGTAAEAEQIDAVGLFPVLDEKTVGPEDILVETIARREPDHAENLLLRAV